MSLKQMIEFWKDGVELGENERYEEAIRKFQDMPEPGSRIYFNIANMYLRLGKLSEAEESLNMCVKKDPHLAIGYFQRGCLSLLNKKNDRAIEDFDLALKNLRGNLLIDYKQLGLIHKLYSCEILYNRAYALYQMGMKSDALQQLEEALAAAADSSESRHQVIRQGIDQATKGQSFLPYKLPKAATLFVPPRTKANVVQQKMDFLGKAKVVSSIVDQDKFAGFVGAQKRKEREGEKSPSPNPPHRSTSPNQPPMKTEEPKTKSRPPKPTMAPPPPHSGSHSSTHNHSPTRGHSPSPTRDPDPRSRSPKRSPSPISDAVTVKIHYTSTRAIRISKSSNLQKLLGMVCKKFDKQEGTLSIWHRIGDTDNLVEIESDDMLRGALSDLEDGFRLTVWAYDKASDGSTDGAVTIVKAIGDYEGQYDDELSFKQGDEIRVINEVNDDWYYGLSKGKKGIFPKCYVK